jgi:hypothetical protein
MGHGYETRAAVSMSIDAFDVVEYRSTGEGLEARSRARNSLAACST